MGTQHGRNGRKIAPQGIVIHYVGNPGSSAKNNRHWFNSGSNGAGVSAHYIIGLEGEIIRCLPDDEMGAHAGRSYGVAWNEMARTNNSRFIGIENCHPTADGRFNAATNASLIWLCADLCKKWNLNPEKDIYRHYDVTGKKCPLFHVQNPNVWVALKRDIAETLNNKQAAQQGIPIAGEPSASLAQMITWAKNRGAAQFLIDLAPYYYERGVKIGIDPAVAWVQTALETGYGNFPTGIIDASWKNTSGLKTTQGGDNSDPESHFRFNTWEDSVDAQFDHLGLYAGLPGFPKAPGQTKDPRHFTWILGTATTMQALKGKWASDLSYDTKLETLIRSLWLTIPAEDAQPEIEQPPPQPHSPSEWARTAWEWAINNRITDGTNPTNTATREQVIQLIYNWQQIFAPQLQGCFGLGS
jgi:flagellum-specific peptidoglycan hydrolase FlgJ